MPQRKSGPEQSALDRSHRDLERVGDLLVVHLFDVPQDEDRMEIRFETANRTLQLLDHLLLLDALVGRRFPVVGKLISNPAGLVGIGRVQAGGARGIETDRLTKPPLSEVRDRGVHDDPDHPGGDRRLSPIRLDALDDFEHRILRHFGRFFAMADHTHRDVEESMSVLFE